MRRLLAVNLLVFVTFLIFSQTVPAGEILQLTDNDYDDESPQIHNGRVVWVGSDGNDDEIFYWDGSTVQQLTDNDYDDKYPHIHNDQVVWQGSDGDDDEIFYWDGLAVQQLTDNDYHDRYPQIHNDQVVWVGSAGKDNEIFYWDNRAAPVANAGADQKDVKENTEVILDGSASNDADGTIDEALI